ncbi:MAG: thioredoxin family protein [Deltaproteobacteria bacterium]|nr:thioredoxin family protein [Deltaproteobacteria bacterium]
MLLLALLLLLPAPAGAAEGITWLDYGKAADLAKQAPRPIMLFFSAPWCYLCKKMQRQVFSDPKLSGRMQKGTYPVLVDVTKQPRLAEIYEIKQVPTTIFLDLNGKPVLRLTGYQNRAALHRAVMFVTMGHHHRMNWESFSSRP